MAELDIMTNISKAMDQRVNKFLFHVARICDDSPTGSVLHNGRSAFGVLQLASDEFYLFQKLERGLECLTREELVNPILADLFNETAQACSWPVRTKHYVFFPNESIEKLSVEPFEFITSSGNLKIGYRYTDLHVGTIKDAKKLIGLCKKLDVDRIEIIDWNGTNIEKEYKENDPIRHISLRNFFLKYFSDEIYSLFINKTVEAVSQANQIVGFNTIPRLSSHYLGSLKGSITESILNTPFDQLKYTGIGNCQLNPHTKKKLSPEDHSILRKHFIGNELFRSLMGEADFGKCFLTSEYLYQVFQDGERLDYTSVVAGYFKSIEQLLYHIMKGYLQHADSFEDLFIKCDHGYRKDDPDFRINPAPKANGAKQVRFTKERENNFSTSMASLAWLLMDNKQGWNISDRGRKIVCSTLLDYIKECRNEHFHKDNIVDYDIVKAIRNNTLLLMYLLIGGCKYGNNLMETRDRLGIISNEFDNLYAQLIRIPRGQYKFILEFNGEEKFKAIRLFDQPITEYDINGSVLSPVVFVKVDDYEIDSEESYQQLATECVDGKRIEISKNNMPSRLWLYVRQDDIREINW